MIITDTAEYEVEQVSQWVTYHRLRRSDSEMIIMTSPGDLIEPHLLKLEEEGFRPSGPVRVMGRGKTIVPYSRDRHEPYSVAGLIAELQKYPPHLPVSLGLGPDRSGKLVEGVVEVVFEKSRGVQLRGRLKK
jgi:hypothetical protein